VGAKKNTTVFLLFRSGAVECAENIVTSYRVIVDGVFGLDIGFIAHLYTQLGTTGNYSATANLHNLQITTEPAKTFPACCVFTSRSLVTASNSRDSSASALESSLNGGSLPNPFQLSRLLFTAFRRELT
jgi:hypothetical protein